MICGLNRPDLGICSSFVELTRPLVRSSSRDLRICLCMDISCVEAFAFALRLNEACHVCCEAEMAGQLTRGIGNWDYTQEYNIL